MRKPSKEQQAWLSDKQNPSTLDRFEDWSRNRRISDLNRAVEEYLVEWESKLTTGPSIITLSMVHEELSNAIRAKIPSIDKFGINVRHDFRAEIQNKLIQILDIQGRAKLELKNCTIKEIVCRERENASSSLTLIDCWVGYLKIGPKSLNYFEMKGGGVKRLHTPLPNENNPFVGSASITSVNFSADVENAQAYRNLRHHLTAIHNLEAASVFHSAEMRTLFKQQNNLDRIFNLIYQGISDYGNSTTRPLWLFFAFAMINFTVFFFTDGVAVPAGVADTGWQLALHNNSYIGNILRSATITLTQIVNPLGIFGLKTLVAAKSILLVMLNVMLCLCATISLGFFIFALRRRFRLSQD